MSALAEAALVLALCVAQASAAVDAESRLGSARLMRIDSTGQVTDDSWDQHASAQGTSGSAIGTQAEEDIFQHASDVVSGDPITSTPRPSFMLAGFSGTADVQESVGDLLDFGDDSSDSGPISNRSSLLDEGVNWHLMASEGAGSCGSDRIRTLSVGSCHGSAPYHYKITDASGGQWVQFKSSTCIFTSSADLNIAISDVSSSSGHIGAGAKFCKACGGSVSFGDTCWGVVTDAHRQCGCNSGGWAGTGMYYGGYTSCNRCACWGGGFSGIKTSGQQKGKICDRGLKIYISKPVDCVWGDYEAWGECSKSCGGGSRKRTRSEKTPAKGGGKPCAGSGEESGECKTEACPTTTTTTTTLKKNKTSSSISLRQPMRALMAVTGIVALSSSQSMPA